MSQPNTANVAAVLSAFGIDLMSQADALWMSFQDRIKKFTEQNGGSASLPTQRNQGGRPDWNEVKRFLKGEITLEEIRSDCEN